MYYVYIFTNKNNRVYYCGVTNNLARRQYEHKNHLYDGFTKRYNVDKLVYYECYDDPKTAIAREKAIKGITHSKKYELIAAMNPTLEEINAAE